MSTDQPGHSSAESGGGPPALLTRTLSEADSKALLASHGVPLALDVVVTTAADAAEAAAAMGFPVVAKLCGDAIAHKTERGLVRLGLRDAKATEAAAAELLAAATAADGDVGVLVAPMVSGNRELIAGLHLDPVFGMTVMLGVGGVLAEAVRDVVFRLVPVTRDDAAEMIDDLKTQRLLDEFRGEPPVERETLIDVIVGLSAAAMADSTIVSADLNPLIVCDGIPTAVDALVEVLS
jgi:acetate---CoA ligase (ADP-forming) subunit beta